jgi:hypothetical protein
MAESKGFKPLMLQVWLGICKRWTSHHGQNLRTLDAVVIPDGLAMSPKNRA